MVANLTTPAVISTPFANGGDKNSIPLNPTGTNLASQYQGFPSITSLPLTQAGLPPERADFNGIFNLLSQTAYFQQNGGCFTFNADVSAALGGYPLNAILWYFPTTGTPYQVVSLIENNTYNFVTTPLYIDNTHWAVYVNPASYALTDLSNVSSNIDYIVENWNNGNLWFRRYKSGRLEQGGTYQEETIVSSSRRIYFPTLFANTLYSFVGVPAVGAAGLTWGIYGGPEQRTTSYITLLFSTGGIGYWDWVAFGYDGGVGVINGNSSPTTVAFRAYKNLAAAAVIYYVAPGSQTVYAVPNGTVVTAQTFSTPGAYTIETWSGLYKVIDDNAISFFDVPVVFYRDFFLDVRV